MSAHSALLLNFDKMSEPTKKNISKMKKQIDIRTIILYNLRVKVFIGRKDCDADLEIKVVFRQGRTVREIFGVSATAELCRGCPRVLMFYCRRDAEVFLQSGLCGLFLP